MEAADKNLLTLGIIQHMDIRFARMKFKEVENDDLYDRLVLIDTEGTDIRPTRDEFNTGLRNFKMQELRTERNKRLAECDWVVIRATSTDKPVPDEWKVYMQALRDLPSNTEDPTNPVWPVRPDEVVPVEETPTEETPPEETPTEETPTEETPTEETPPEETPTEETPTEETPVEETPTEETPTEETPTE